MKSTDPQVTRLSESLTDELVGAVGLPKNRFTHGLFWKLFRGITDRMAALGVPFDRIIGDEGFPAGCAWGLTHFCHPTRVIGQEHIPQAGPLLVLINHPGAYDTLVVVSHLIRKDIKLVSSEIPFFHHLPHASRHFIFSSKDDSKTRMLVFKNAIKHLRQQGALVYVGAGHREPDPAVYTGAHDSMHTWLDVFDSFFKYIPGLQIMPVVMSGMILPRWAKHPITRLRRKQIDQQRLAEFGQVISQLLRPGKTLIKPNLSFGKPFSEEELREQVGRGKLRKAVIARSQALLDEHCQTFALSGAES